MDIMERRKNGTFSLSLHVYASGCQENEQRQHTVLALNSPRLVLGVKSPQLIQRQRECENGKRMRDELPPQRSASQVHCGELLPQKKDILYFLNYKNHTPGLM